jgi:hypothetical protein
MGVFVSKGRWLPISFGLGCTVLLLSARSFSFSREWFAVGRVLGNSLELRKQARYALCMNQWLELEAERPVGPEELWASFGFTAKKLGFTAVTLTTPDGRKHWNWTVAAANGTRQPPRRISCEFGQGLALEFVAAATVLEERAFDLLTDLATEGWATAVKRWQQVHGHPVRFKPIPVAAAPTQAPASDLLSGQEPRPA